MAVAVMSAAWAEPSRRTRLGAVRAHPSTWTPTTSGHVVTVAIVFTVTSKYNNMIITKQLPKKGSLS